MPLAAKKRLLWNKLWIRLSRPCQPPGCPPLHFVLRKPLLYWQDINLETSAGTHTQSGSTCICIWQLDSSTAKEERQMWVCILAVIGQAHTHTLIHNGISGRIKTCLGIGTTDRSYRKTWKRESSNLFWPNLTWSIKQRRQGHVMWIPSKPLSNERHFWLLDPYSLLCLSLFIQATWEGTLFWIWAPAPSRLSLCGHDLIASRKIASFQSPIWNFWF